MPQHASDKAPQQTAEARPVQNRCVRRSHKGRATRGLSSLPGRRLKPSCGHCRERFVERKRGGQRLGRQGLTKDNKTRRGRSLQNLSHTGPAGLSPSVSRSITIHRSNGNVAALLALSNRVTPSMSCSLMWVLM